MYKAYYFISLGNTIEADKEYMVIADCLESAKDKLRVFDKNYCILDNIFSIDKILL